MRHASNCEVSGPALTDPVRVTEIPASPSNCGLGGSAVWNSFTTEKLRTQIRDTKVAIDAQVRLEVGSFSHESTRLPESQELASCGLVSLRRSISLMCDMGGLSIFVAVLLALCGSVAAQADEPKRIEITDFVPYGREPVEYFAAKTNDAVSRLQERLQSGTVKLTADSSRGYLKSLLAELRIPTSSQLLVFSKTARNPDLIGPKHPRAIYFNDEVTVGWVPGALELELTASDPEKGITFYTLAQPTKDAPSTELQFHRKDQCLACHAGRSTFEVPGLLLRAFQTDASGKPVMGYSVMNQDSPYEKRWGGWFVVGTPPGFDHRGNLIGNEDNELDRDEPGFRASRRNLNDLERLNEYATDTSDIIAHLVLAHQTHGLNLIARVGLEARFHRRSDAEEKLVRCLVFADEPRLPRPLDAATISKSEYRAWFESQRPTAGAGRSLRQFDLQTRVFKHRLSYLIEHPMFVGLPADCRARLFARLRAGFSSQPAAPGFDHLSEAERSTLHEIVKSMD